MTWASVALAALVAKAEVGAVIQVMPCRRQLTWRTLNWVMTPPSTV